MPVEAGAVPIPAQKEFVPMEDIHNGLAVLDELGKQPVVIGVLMGVMGIIIHPNAMKQPERFLPCASRWVLYS